MKKRRFVRVRGAGLWLINQARARGPEASNLGGRRRWFGLPDRHVKDQARRPGTLRHDDLVLWIDPTHVDFPVGQHRDHSWPDANENQLSALGALDRPVLDAGKVGRLGPRIWKTWIDADLEVNSVLLQVNDKLGFFRLPFRTEARVLHPRAVKRAARGRPVRVD